jgi:hypothetical protein
MEGFPVKMRILPFKTKRIYRNLLMGRWWRAIGWKRAGCWSWIDFGTFNRY